uniref:Isopenicillin N synthase-like Fe(2+) 2OG dioxygenase domain-containing protein n=1 Tax=Chenopodium quinoa TaxID=63459 RepID=A0A803LH23_CHEQI
MGLFSGMIKQSDNQSQVMANGVFKGDMHRVITSSLSERISVAAFCHPDKDQEIGPVSKLISVHKPQLYKKFNIYEFQRTFFKSHALGHRPLDPFKLSMLMISSLTTTTT